jgi:hypothetical protein
VYAPAEGASCSVSAWDSGQKVVLPLGAAGLAAALDMTASTTF